MRYPYIRYHPDIVIKPIFRILQGPPLVFDLSGRGVLFDDLEARNQKELQRRIDRMLAEGGYDWGVSSYLEYRKHLLSDCPQMIEENRFYHLGMDVIVPLGTPLHAPLAAGVEASGYEAGEGNYGGYVLLRHENPAFEAFYSFYGHLRRDTLPTPGHSLQVGDAFAEIGDFHENGNWFHHVHLQVITEQGLEKGYQFKGYCSTEDLAGIDRICPDPLALLVSENSA